jgi:hypothetical protein
MLAGCDLFQGGQQFGRFDFADGAMPDFGFPFTIEPTVALGVASDFASGLRLVSIHLSATSPNVCAAAAARLSALRFSDGSIGEQALCFDLNLARHRQRNERNGLIACRRRGTPAARAWNPLA